MTETLPHRSFARPGRLLASLIPVTLGVQACSFASSVVLARILGATVGTDAYFLALSVPATTAAILMAALRLGAIPALTEHRLASVEDREEDFATVASALFTAVIVVSAGLTLAITAVTLVLLPLSLGSGSRHLVHLTQLSVLALSPLGLLGATAGVLGAILAADGRFVAGIAVMAFEPVLKVAFVLTLGPRLGAGALVLGSVAGSLLAAVLLFYVVRRDGTAVSWRRRPATPFVRQVARLSTPLLISQSVLQINPVLDRLMAAPLGSGSVTELELGLRLFAIPATLTSATLIAPLTATWAARMAEDGWPAVKDSLGRSIHAAAVALPPFVTLAFILRHDVVRLIYSGGAYSKRALAHTGDVLGMLVLGLPAQIFVVFFATLFIVGHDSIVPMKIAFANVVLNAGLNVLLRGAAGVSGLALSTSLTLSILVVAYAVVAHRRWGPFHFAGGRRVVLSAGVSIVIIAVVARLVHQLLDFNGGQSGAATAIVTIGGVGLAVHALVVCALGAGRVDGRPVWSQLPELRPHG